MPVSAAVVQVLLDVGVAPHRLVEVIAVIDAETAKKETSKALKRIRNQRFYAERKRLKTADSVANSVAADSVAIQSFSVASRVGDNLFPIEESGLRTQEAKASFVGRTRKSRRCPVEWLPSHTTLALADHEGFSADELERELERFRDHEFPRPYTDWDATFKNWLRTARDRRSQRINGHSEKYIARQANLERAQQGFEASVRFRDAAE
jgi:hypothetical protein